jgi:D-alanine-D-alanine ligase-like ATP-grasp enzyme
MALVLRGFKIEPCEECGMEAVHHGRERFFLSVDLVFRKIFRPLDKFLQGAVMPLADAFLDWIGPMFSRLMFALGLATKVSAPDKHSSEAAQALWKEAAKRGIEMYEMRPFGLPRRQFIAQRGSKSFSFEGLPRPARARKSLFWIDDKLEVKKRFLEAGFPVPKGRSAGSESEALQIFSELGKPVIVKPREGSGGRHTTVNIGDEEALIAAYRNARLVAPGAIVEEQFFGPVFRATIVDRKLAAVLRRDPPEVIGDGQSTVRQLVEEENRNPLRRGPVFAEINMDSPASRRELVRQGLSPESVPNAGQRVQFHFKVNWGVGGTSRDATLETHPENVKLFNEIGEFLGEDIAGIDFIIPDISVSWRDEPRCGIIECNSLPAIGNHHFPFTGPERNVAGAIWDMVFPDASPADSV